jgi:hypothetical protein
LFDPLARFRISVERHACRMRVKRCAHSFLSLSK